MAGKESYSELKDFFESSLNLRYTYVNYIRISSQTVYFRF